jgi:hypothetical protein
MTRHDDREIRTPCVGSRRRRLIPSARASSRFAASLPWRGCAFCSFDDATLRSRKARASAALRFMLLPTKTGSAPRLAKTRSFIPKPISAAMTNSIASGAAQTKTPHWLRPTCSSGGISRFNGMRLSRRRLMENLL